MAPGALGPKSYPFTMFHYTLHALTSPTPFPSYTPAPPLEVVGALPGAALADAVEQRVVTPPLLGAREVERGQQQRLDLPVLRGRG